MSSCDTSIVTERVEVDTVNKKEMTLINTDDSHDVQSFPEGVSPMDSSQLDDNVGIIKTEEEMSTNNDLIQIGNLETAEDTDRMQTSSEDKETSTIGDKDTETETDAEPNDHSRSVEPSAQGPDAAYLIDPLTIVQTREGHVELGNGTAIHATDNSYQSFLAEGAEFQPVRATGNFGTTTPNVIESEAFGAASVLQSRHPIATSNQYVSGDIPAGGFMHAVASPVGSITGFDTTTSFEQSRRKVSSVIVSSEFLGPPPQSGNVKYVEIPMVEEIIKRIPKREIVEVEKIVPKFEVEYIERRVETPRVQYIDRIVEIPQTQEVVRSIPIKKVVEVPREVIRSVPQIQYVNVEKTVDVPGPVIEVEKAYIVHTPVETKRWVDKNAPVVVAQTIRPVVTESSEVIDVDVFEYEPRIIPVEVQVAKPVSAHLAASGIVQEQHQFVSVPAAQYNTILKSLNAHLGAAGSSELPYMRAGTQIPFLASHETPGTAVPVPQAQIGQVLIGMRGETSTMHDSDIIGPTVSAKLSLPPLQASLELKSREASVAGQSVCVSPRASGISHRTSTAVPAMKQRSSAHQSTHKSVKSAKASVAPNSTTAQHKKKRACAC